MTLPLRFLSALLLALLALPALAQQSPYPNPTFSGLQMLGTINAFPSSPSASGLNLGIGAAPTACRAGDLWETSAGVFACPAGTAVGPFGAGSSNGSVVSGLANAVPWYAAAGTVLSPLTPANNALLVTSNSGVPSLSNTLPPFLIIPNAVVTPQTYTLSTLPGVSTANAGTLAYVSNCQNGSQTGGSATGCLYIVNNLGVWAPVPTIPTQQITIGGQAIYLGGATVNQGTGTKIVTASGTFTSGDCPSIGSGGQLIDSGAPCVGGTGGSGTVNAGTTNELAFYASGGTAISPIATANSSVLATSSGGVPGYATTLPTGLTIPSATLSNPAMTGTATYLAMTGTGKLITAASTTTQAGLNLPSGVAPTSPAAGDVWMIGTALQARLPTGATITIGTGAGTVTSVATSLPISGGTITGGGTIACPTCATTTNGGQLTATSPMAISAGGAISLGSVIGGWEYVADSATTVINYTYPIDPSWSWATGSINSVSYETGGSSTPSFSIALQISGTNVATCNGITVASGTLITTTCGSNSIVRTNPVTLVISGVSGAPNSACVKVNYSHSAI